MGSESGGLWFLRYWQKVFQSRRFWFSYRLGVVALLEVEDGDNVAVDGVAGGVVLGIIGVMS
jgi:hypothetical protein